jgi:hypothetical protein
MRSSIVGRRAIESNDDDDDDGSVGISDDDVVAPPSSTSSDGDNDDDEDDSWTSPKSKKQPTLAELEDYEEARLAELERRMIATTNTIGGGGGMVEGADAIGGGVPLSNLYSVVYTNEISARSSSRAGSMAVDDDDRGRERGNGIDDDYEYPPPLSPQREMYLAKKRDLLQNGRFNEMFAEEDKANADRQNKIRMLMEEDDRAWKEERRRRLLGKYADVGSWEEVERLLDEDRTREARGTCLFVFLVSLLIFRRRFAASVTPDACACVRWDFFGIDSPFPPPPASPSPYDNRLLFFVTSRAPRNGIESRPRKTRWGNPHHARARRINYLPVVVVG